MKQIFLVLTLIYLAACEDHLNDNGPANNVEYRPYGLCEDYYVYNGTGWLDDSEKTVSDCVDLNLYSK
jgi:hypothetical protein